jgi:hypothetical protein
LVPLLPGFPCSAADISARTIVVTHLTGSFSLSLSLSLPKLSLYIVWQSASNVIASFPSITVHHENEVNLIAMRVFEEIPVPFSILITGPEGTSLLALLPTSLPNAKVHVFCVYQRCMGMIAFHSRGISKIYCTVSICETWVICPPALSSQL